MLVSGGGGEVVMLDINFCPPFKGKGSQVNPTYTEVSHQKTYPKIYPKI